MFNVPGAQPDTADGIMILESHVDATVKAVALLLTNLGYEKLWSSTSHMHSCMIKEDPL